MPLENLVVVSGMPGVYRMVTNRGNGLIVEDLDNGKKRFAPARKHQFTPLESIAIYTVMDSVPLDTVFQKMLAQTGDNPPVSAKASATEINEYFTKILPDFDRGRVHVSDIKKVIKWFNFLSDRKLISLQDSTDEEE